MKIIYDIIIELIKKSPEKNKAFNIVLYTAFFGFYKNKREIIRRYLTMNKKTNRYIIKKMDQFYWYFLRVGIIYAIPFLMACLVILNQNFNNSIKSITLLSIALFSTVSFFAFNWTKPKTIR